MTKSGKHCGKRRNCLFCAISSCVTMFSKSCLLQRCQKASIWGKGLITLSAVAYLHTILLKFGILEFCLLQNILQTCNRTFRIDNAWVTSHTIMTFSALKPRMTQFRIFPVCWGFTPFSTLFQFIWYHCDSSLIYYPWVNKPLRI